MKKYRCEVTTRNNYEIEIDDEELGEDFLENFREYFFDFDDWEEHAQHLAKMKAIGCEFMEGYGVPLIDGKNPNEWCNNKTRDLEKAINIKILSEDNVEVDSYEI